MDREESAKRRLGAVTAHLKTPHAVDLATEQCKGDDPRGRTGGDRAFPVRRQEELHWNGWGYRDSGFFLNKRGQVEFKGKRYPIGGQELPYLREFLDKAIGFDPSVWKQPRQEPNVDDLADPVRNDGFVRSLRRRLGDKLEMSTDGVDRIVHSHGHTFEEAYALAYGKMKRYVDLIVWPADHDEVVQIVEAACAHNVCLIPSGGCTNVSGALICPEDEKRMIVSVDTTKMNKILWIDKDNLTVHAQAGIIGQDLERQLEKHGYCTGHEPDSMELSSLGGWVATRASGMKKNVYGNIEDLLVRVKFVSPQGVVEKSCMAPRVSVGPDIHQFILGSEGMFGVVTEVTLRIRPLPTCRRYGSIVFPDFESGVAFLREVAKQRCAPASVRLVDNQQFQFGQALKGPAGSIFTTLMDSFKKIYVTKFKGFDPLSLCGTTLLFEGSAEDVKLQQKRIFQIASRFRGLSGGEENGRRGYLLTFLIAYIRDFGLPYCFIGESFETSVPWPRVLDLCRNTKDRIRRECKKLNTKFDPLVSCRVTQTYDAGACVYFYMAFSAQGIADPVQACDDVESAARDEVIASGGSLSHHHGVGKLRKRWVVETLSSPGVEMIKAVKQHIDPNNIFGCQNLIPKWKNWSVADSYDWSWTLIDPRQIYYVLKSTLDNASFLICFFIYLSCASMLSQVKVSNPSQAFKIPLLLQLNLEIFCFIGLVEFVPNSFWLTELWLKWTFHICLKKTCLVSAFSWPWVLLYYAYPRLMGKVLNIKFLLWNGSILFFNFVWLSIRGQSRKLL